METKNLIFIVGTLIILSSIVLPLVSAKEVNDASYLKSGIDLNGLITIGSSILAIILFVITFIAYKRDGRKRLLYVSIAFFLFAVKGVLISIDALLPLKLTWTDPLGNFLDFAILLSFFFGVMKKGG